MYEIGSTPLNITHPTYTMSPPSCSNNQTFTYELVQKDSDPVYGTGAPFSDLMTGLPSFFSVTPSKTNITISGTNRAEAWNTYRFRVIMYDTKANITNSDFEFTVTTFIDCTKVKEFPYVVPPPTIVIYEIAEPTIQTII